MRPSAWIVFFVAAMTLSGALAAVSLVCGALCLGVAAVAAGWIRVTDSRLLDAVQHE